MKKILLSLFAVCVLTCFSSTAALADNLKIGVIDLQQLLQNLPQMTQMTNNMKAKFGDREKQLSTAQASFKQGVENFQKNMAVMSNKDKQAGELKLRQQGQALQQMQGDFQKDYQDYMTDQNKQVNVLLEKIKAVVNTIATRDKYNLILVNSGVAYSDPAMDVTQVVLAEMKKSS